MAGRPKTFDTEKALAAFVDIFWTKGYQHTSVDDLQEAAGIKRGSFYSTFGSKDEVFEGAVEKYWNDVSERGFRNLDNEEPREALARFIRHVGEFMCVNTPRGCLLLTASSDPACSQSHEAAFIEKKMKMLEGRIMRVFHETRENAPSTNTAQLTSFVLATVLGLNAMARTSQGSEKILAAADFAAKSVLNNRP